MEIVEDGLKPLLDRWKSLEGAEFNSTIGTNPDGTFLISPPVDDASLPVVNGKVQEEASGFFSGIAAALSDPVSVSKKVARSVDRSLRGNSTETTADMLYKLIIDTDASLNSNLEYLSLIQMRKVITVAKRSITNLFKTERSGCTHLRTLTSNERRERAALFAEVDRRIDLLFQKTLHPLIEAKAKLLIDKLIHDLHETFANPNYESYDCDIVKRHLGVLYGDETVQETIDLKKMYAQWYFSQKEICSILIELFFRLTPKTLLYIKRSRIEWNGMSLGWILSKLRAIRISSYVDREDIEKVEFMNRCNQFVNENGPYRNQLIYVARQMQSSLSSSNRPLNGGPLEFNFPFRPSSCGNTQVLQSYSFLHDANPTIEQTIFHQLQNPNQDDSSDTVYCYLKFHNTGIPNNPLLEFHLINLGNKIVKTRQFSDRHFDLELIIDGETNYSILKCFSEIIKNPSNFFLNIKKLTVTILEHPGKSPQNFSSIISNPDFFPDSIFDLKLLSTEKHPSNSSLNILNFCIPENGNKNDQTEVFTMKDPFVILHDGETPIQ